MEKGRKRALRVLDSLDAAVEWLEAHGMSTDDGRHSIEFREGEDTKCSGYCPVADFCPHAKRVKA